MSKNWFYHKGVPIMMMNIRNDDDVETYVIVLSFKVDEERAMVVFESRRQTCARKYFSYDLNFRNQARISCKTDKLINTTESPLEIPFVHLAGTKPFYTNTLFLAHGTKLIFVEPADRDRLCEILAEKAPPVPPTSVVGPTEKMWDFWERMNGRSQSCDRLEMKCISCKITDDDSAMEVTFVMRLVNDADVIVKSETKEEEEEEK